MALYKAGFPPRPTVPPLPWKKVSSTPCLDATLAMAKSNLEVREQTKNITMYKKDRDIYLPGLCIEPSMLQYAQRL